MSVVTENQEPRVISIASHAKRPSRGRATGPRTPKGKSVASTNATTHGCTATFPVVDGRLTPEALARIVLPDEKLVDWEAVHDSWQKQYQIEDEPTRTLVTQAAIADWILRRTSRRYNEVEQSLFREQADATAWNPEQHAQLQRFLRYRTAAERSFYRARTALEQLRREKKIDELRRTKDESSKARGLPHAAPGSPAAARQSGTANTPATVERDLEVLLPRPTGALIQCITVQVLDGQTFTLFQPRSENLERIIRSADEPKPLVKRALYFLHGIPEEYQWITDYESHDGRPHFVITRTSAEALRDLERERTSAEGHVLEPHS